MDIVHEHSWAFMNVHGPVVMGRPWDCHWAATGLPCDYRGAATGLPWECELPWLTRQLTFPWQFHDSAMNVHERSWALIKVHGTVVIGLP